MQRFRTVSQAAAVVLLLSLLLTACRITAVPSTAYPGTTSYPGPRTQNPTRAPTTGKAATRPIAPTVVPPPTRAPTRAATTAPAQVAPPGEVTFTLNIVHTGEVNGEVSPCG